MCEFIITMIAYLKSINWPDVLQGIGSVWVAIVATRALNTWKQQSRAQRQMDFMDELTDAVHEFIQLMSAPTTMLNYIKINIESYSITHRLNTENKFSGIIAYIQKRGEKDQKKLSEYLAPCRPVISKIRSLSAKGQVLDLTNYDSCRNACELLGTVYDQIEAISYIIGNVTLNWDNPEIQKTLAKVMKIDSQSIEKNLKDQNILFLTFVKDNYRAIHNRTKRTKRGRTL